MYVITAVRYSTTPKHIQSVKASKLDGSKLVDETEYARSVVVDAIKNKHIPFITAYKQNGQYHEGAKVEVIPVNWTDYLKTVNDGTEKDNLGSLPTF